VIATPTPVPPPPKAIRSEQARALQGTRAGFASRIVADGIDLGMVVGIYFFILLAYGAVRYLFVHGTFTIPQPDVFVTTIGGWAIAVLYLTIGWASTGRTIGKSTMGLRVVNNNGKPLRSKRAFLRALICASLGWELLLWIIVSRRRAGVHDLMVRTTVVYDWTTRA
jgi:uncharacterized RDD family membrane protein YckC